MAEGHHLEKYKNRYIFPTVWPIWMTFGVVMHFGPTHLSGVKIYDFKNPIWQIFWWILCIVAVHFLKTIKGYFTCLLPTSVIVTNTLSNLGKLSLLEILINQQILYRNKKLCYGRGTAQHACQYRTKTCIDEWPWHISKVITVGISFPVCGLLFQRLYLGPFLRHYHFWRERDCLAVTLSTPSFLTTKLKLQAMCAF